MAAAAAIVAFLGGLVVGGRLRVMDAHDAPIEQERFVLLLYESEEYANATTPDAEVARVHEYGEWAGNTARSGRFVTGEKLAYDGRWCRMRGDALETAPPIADAVRGTLAGYFIIGAASYDDAVAITRDCPHLKYGGSIEVRRIEPT
ncbi:MAG: YciI family protein [bacterium]